MLIGIDGNEANVEKRVGIGEYVFELLRQLKEFRIQNSEFRIYLKRAAVGNLPAEDNNWNYRIVGPGMLWTQIGLPYDLYFHFPRPDVFFTPGHYVPRFCPVPVVMSIMDLSYIYFPNLFKKNDLYQLVNWTAYSVKKASKIITISKSSRNDIIKYYKLGEDKVVVIYPGMKKAGPKKQNQKDLIEKKYGISKKYILFVGTLQPRKNIVRLIEAFSKIKNSKKGNLELVIIGKKGWMYEEILAAPAKFAVADKVRFLDFIPDEDLTAFYSNAACFVLPSLYEGFGLPVLEAMSNNCPVITSNISSLPEAGGDAALYVDPYDVDDIASKIQILLDDNNLKQKMVKMGLEHIKKFSWETAARQTLEVLQEVAKR